MLTQSGGGTVYAVLADTDEHEVAIAVQSTVLHNSVFMSIRIRYKSRTKTRLDRMDVPKKMLADTAESGSHTLRTLLAVPTGVAPSAITDVFGEEWARKIQNASGGVILEEDGILEKVNIRTDFIKDFGDLVMKSLEQFYPLRFLPAAPDTFLSPSDAPSWIKRNAATKDGDTIVEVVADTDGVVLKANFGVDKKPTKH